MCSDLDTCRQWFPNLNLPGWSEQENLPCQWLQELYSTHQYWWFSVPILNYIFTIYIIVYTIYRVYKRQMSCFGEGPFFLPSFSSPPFPPFTVFSHFLLPSLFISPLLSPKKPAIWSRAVYAPLGWPGMELQPKLNLMHYSSEICHLMTAILVTVVLSY